MYVIPAIDLRSGKCVRLIQGQYHRQITYRDDPVAQAEDFVTAGAEWLHVVDLDGAKLGKLVNIEPISAIVRLGKCKVELGGGIRDEKTISQLLDLGADRLIIGTRAVTDFEWFQQVAGRFSGKLALALDAHGSKVATEGWTKNRPETLLEFAQKAAQLPLSAIIYTDITRDGMLSGPNLERTGQLVKAVSVPVVASGGVNSVDDIHKLADLAVAGVIVGRALYEGTLNLADAIKAARS